MKRARYHKSDGSSVSLRPRKTHRSLLAYWPSLTEVTLVTLRTLEQNQKHHLPQSLSKSYAVKVFNKQKYFVNVTHIKMRAYFLSWFAPLSIFSRFTFRTLEKKNF